MKYTEEEKKAIKDFKEDTRNAKIYKFQKRCEVNIKILDLLEKQQKEIEELKSKTQIISPLYIKENYLPKEAIRKKIKEIDENGYWDFLEERDCEKTINILKELLGDE